MSTIIQTIEKQIKNNKIIIYIKGTPENPMCGFSAQAIHILNELNINYAYVDVLENQEIRQNLPKYLNWPTFPQLFYKEKLIGGADIISELHKNNKLLSTLSK
ncbi:MAG TPA: Grx4 family monothiol glutaredoxin [Candidatus Azoamicus sp.]